MLPHWTNNDYTIDHTTLHYVRTSPPGSGKPPAVLAHGFSDDGLCWAPTARELEDRFDVILPDAIGHGRSQRVQRGQKTDMPADLAGLMGGLGLAPAVLAGHSMGAVVAAQVAARYPEQVRALILEDPAWFLPAPGQTPGRGIAEDSPLGAWIKSLQGLTPDEVVEKLRPEHPTWSDEALRAWCEAKTRLDLNFLTTQDSSWEDWRGVAGKIQCPVLLVTADNDKGGIVSPELARMAVEINPRIRVAHIPGAGHHVRFEQYPAYMAALRAFLAEIG